MKRFILVTAGELIEGVEFESGQVAIDSISSTGPYGEYNAPCEAFDNLRRLRYSYGSPIVWIDATEFQLTQEQLAQIESIRQQWIANGYKIEPKEYDVLVKENVS